jgi:hypothetical protein
MCAEIHTQTHRGSMANLKQRNVHRVARGRSAHGLVLACAIVVAAAACATAEPTVAVVAQPGVAFSLPVGQTASINGSGTKITFRQVKADSRCPTDVQCVWEGDAQIEVTVSRNGSPDDTKILSLHTPNEMTSGDLQIRFVGLTPVPRQADGSAPRAYVAQLVANRI